MRWPPLHESEVRAAEPSARVRRAASSWSGARSLALILLAALFTVCAQRPPPGVVTTTAARHANPAAPLPPFFPSPATVRDNAALPTDALTAVERCSVCHADVFAQWSGSAHRYSSLDNPFYLPAFENARHDRGVAAGRWCGGCHDPALLFTGGLDTASVDRADERAHLGVGCLLCHSVERLHDRTGNGNYVLSPESVPFPPREARGRVAAAAHVARVDRDVLRSAEFCGSCHKVSLDEPVNAFRWMRGQDDFDAWDQSAFAGNSAERMDQGISRQTCQDCHMPTEPAVLGDLAAHDGRIRSHRFLGGHTALAAYRNDADTLARERAMLHDAVRIDVFRTPDLRGAGAAPMERSPLRAGEHARLDVVLVNDRVGHRFPGGTADVADTWVELTVLDAHGRTVLANGVMDSAGNVPDDAHRLEVRPLDEDGHPAVMRDPHRFRAIAYDSTLPPRAARVVRYAIDVPANASEPFTVRARLLHRRIAQTYYRAACERAPSQQGSACPVEPVTEISRYDSSLNADASQLAQRWYDHGRALAEGSLQEDVGQAQGSLLAFAALRPDDPRGWIERARVAMRAGRTVDANAALDRAESLAPGTAVVPYLRGMAFEDVWRFGEAVEPLQRAHALSPGNLRAAEMLANALGIAGRDRDALAVITDGMSVDPEDAQLFNLRAVSLRTLGDTASADEARQAFLRYRAFDGAPGLRAACKREVQGCAREAAPLHEHVLHTPG